MSNAYAETLGKWDQATKDGSLPASPEAIHATIREHLVTAENWCAGALTALGCENMHEVAWRASQAIEQLLPVVASVNPTPRDLAIVVKDEELKRLRAVIAELTAQLHGTPELSDAAIRALRGLAS